MLTFDSTSDKRLRRKHPLILEIAIAAKDLEKPIFLKRYIKGFYKFQPAVIHATQSMNAEYFLIMKYLTLQLTIQVLK